MPFECTLQLFAQGEADRRHILDKANSERWDVKGIFDTKPNSGYDDEATRRYHFPPQYRAVVEKLVGDWIIYRETQRNRGRRAYVAFARVVRIHPDLARHGHAYAVVGDYLAFDRLVAFSGGSAYAESALRELADPRRIGAYLKGKSVRIVADPDFAAIVRSGLAETLNPITYCASGWTTLIPSRRNCFTRPWRNKREGSSKSFLIGSCAKLISDTKFVRLTKIGVR